MRCGLLDVLKARLKSCFFLNPESKPDILDELFSSLAQEVERVGWQPQGCWFDPQLLPAECRGVPEQDASP